MLAAAGTGIQVGAAIVATRFVIGETDPVTLAMLRYMIAFLCVLPGAALAWRAIPPGLPARDVAAVAALGIIQFGLVIALLNFALTRIPSGRAALIFATFPLQTMLIAAALGREPLTRPKVIGVGLTILGVALALGDKLAQGGGGGEWLGALAVFASAFCGAFCSVFYRPYLRRYPTLPVSALAMLASTLFLLAWAGLQGSLGGLGAISSTGWAAVIFIGLSSGIGFFWWLWALAHATPTRVTVFLALSPITAALLGALLLAEGLAPLLLAGLACVVLGLWAAHREA